MCAAQTRAPFLSLSDSGQGDLSVCNKDGKYVGKNRQAGVIKKV